MKHDTPDVSGKEIVGERLVAVLHEVLTSKAFTEARLDYTM